MSSQYNTIKKDVPHIFLNEICPSFPPKSQMLPYDGGFNAQLLSSLGFDPEDPPMAALLDGDYIMSPVHWEATHNNAFIRAEGDTLQCSREESRLWCEALAAFLDEVGLKLHYIDEYTWLVRADSTVPTLHAKPVYQMAHVPLLSTLSTLDSTQYWQRIHTEIQMFLSTHPLQKLCAGTLPVNGVWIWGGARIHQRSDKLIYAEESTFSLAKKLSSSVDLYQPENTYKGSVLLLLNQSQHHPTIKQASCWFWRNIAYSMPPSSRWLRFLEKINPCT